MRTPKREVSSSGEVYFTVRYRNPPGGPQRKLAFYGDTEEVARRDAATFAAVLSASGADAAVRWWNSNLGDEPGTQGMTLDDWWPKYLEQKTGITPGTRDSCDRIYKRIWKPHLGHLPLTAIQRVDITRVINQMAADGRADKTIANFYGVLTTCLKMALEDGHIAALPTRKIKLPRNTEHETEEMRFLSHDEWADIQLQLRKRGTGHYVPLFTFLVGSGARWGEAEALTVGDVTQRRVRLEGGGTIMVWHARINKAAKWNVSSRNREVGPPKTRKSRRTIPLGPEVMVELAPLLAGRAKTGRLFLAPQGGSLDHAEAWRVWTAVRKAAEIDDPQPRIHDLRHTHASWLLDAGVPVHVVSARLGHESIQTTVDVYGHGSADAHLAAVDAASLAMRPRELARPAVDH